MVTTFLALGSNMGDRASFLKKAIEGLAEHGVEIVRRASIYETEPKDVGAQPWFLNTVVEGNTLLEPRALLECCLSIERKNHRLRREVKSARTLDIDIVFYGAEVIDDPFLQVPHPRFSERKFVLMPLAELAPRLIDPKSGRSVASLLQACNDVSEVRLLA